MPKLDIRQGSKVFNAGKSTLHALQDINLSVNENEFVTLVGASGCGKSTLLRIIGGLENFTAGDVSVNALPVVGPGLDRAIVFQDYSVYPWLTVAENIRFCRELKAHQQDNSLRATYHAIGRAHALLELMGLNHVKDAYPNQLSGGMR